ncbi:uncharacterized protein HMPREF1541_07596 [Cyphellophora europaea CBS 101466]|uniref:Bromo domain-containing protein n=1 Tax=Cyphellophora europaea (strain CBS 101466) TaxID=1220924 RepID=W2RQJ4_CYPE1|nr:uncharacterized protein HMPREF1541_07596 [Cyphellophora europaea CBS 101466]ETN37973.1 hypothetical protein HMPREF1541_07596 [Cyphellophora europaea CBS 101466]
MDVEMTMESQGLPKQFGTTSQQPEPERIASNVEASVSNAEIPSAPSIEVKATPNSSESAIPQPETSHATINGDHSEPRVNGVEDSKVAEPELPSAPVSVPTMPTESGLPPQQPPVTSSNATSFADSVIPSSLPAEAQSSIEATEITQATTDTIPDSVPQPPMSDLRSPPHADELAPAQVAEIEAQKHAEDNAAVAEVPSQSEIAPAVDSTPALEAPSVLAASSPSVVPQVAKVGDTGLATPPIHTPPLVPQVASANVPDSLSAVVPPENPAEPTPTPAEPISTPAEPTPTLEKPEDDVMTDAPPAKVAREREEDQSESERAAKRLKTDEPESSFKVPNVPAAASPSPATGTPAPTSNANNDGDGTITTARLTHMKKIISNLKKSKASAAFRQPVDPVALNIPTYVDIVKNPMDLGKIDQKLKTNSYSNVSEFRSDFELIVSNCVAFNGSEHGVTQQAFTMQTSFNNQMQQLPKVQYAEPSKEEKKAARAKQEPTRTAPPRRPSVTAATPPASQGTARSPRTSVSASTPAFAPGPDGVPLIRRDSNMADGRPKRQIVPPKRNQEYAGGRPKKKKYELQLRFCQEVLKELTAPKNWAMNQYFTHPVDPVALNIPTYFQIIKKPMDLSTIQTKLDNNVYEKAKDFEEDVRLIFKNCYKFNPDGDWVHNSGKQLESLFNSRWAGKEDWIASREPQSDPQSEAEDDDSDDESEDDAEDSEVERNDKIAMLQKQIAEMSKQMGELTQSKGSKKKKSKSPNAPTSSKKAKNKSKKEKPKTTFPGLQKTEKKKSVPKAKPEREKFVTFQEKQYISNGIAMLPEKQMSEALRIIQQSVPALANSNESEIELDIEEVPNFALVKLLNFVKKYAGPPPEETKGDEGYVPAPAPAAATKSKKNKPMSKAQQEAQIDELKGKLSAYAGGPASPGAMQSIENDESSDNDDSEESEED